MGLSRSQLAGGLVTVVLVAVIGTALVLLGSPADERARRLDARRVADLVSLSRAVDLYSTRHGSLPASLALIQREQGVSVETADPETNAPYEYRGLEGQAFEVCAQFETESRESDREGANDFWSHGTGRQCFRRDVRKVE